MTLLLMGAGKAVDAAANVTRYRDAVLADSPTSYWRLAEASGATAADVQGVNAGTYVGTLTYGQPSAISDTGDKSVTLGGTSHIATGFSPFTVGGKVTIEGWVNTVAPSGRAIWGSSAAAGPLLFFDSATTLTYYPRNATGTTWAAAWPGNGQWVHTVFLLDDTANTAELFINGVSQTSKATTQTLSTIGTFEVGGAGGANNRINGSIDEFAVYSGVLLSSARISAHYGAR